MITTDFAPNESLDDALLSLKLLFQPWRWLNGKETDNTKVEIIRLFNREGKTKQFVSCFLSARSALYFLLKSLNLSETSKILVQAFTCEAVILPILENNLTPVYVDIESGSYSINPIDLERKIDKNTRVLILQHTYGMTPTYRDKIISVIKKHDLLLIEDIAHGMQISNLKFQISNSTLLMSFGRSKALSSVFGGAIITDKLHIFNKVENLRKNLNQPSMLFILRSLLYKPLTVLIKSTYGFFYIGKILHKVINLLKLLPSEITFEEKRGNYNHIFDKKLPNALSILLLHQLKKFNKIKKQRSKIVYIYNKYLRTFINPLIRYPLLVLKRDAFIESAKKENIFLGRWYDQVVAPKSLNLSKVNYTQGSCPQAEKICDKIINLPLNITENEAYKIIDFIKKNQ